MTNNDNRKVRHIGLHFIWACRLIPFAVGLFGASLRFGATHPPTAAPTIPHATRSVRDGKGGVSRCHRHGAKRTPEQPDGEAGTPKLFYDRDIALVPDNDAVNKFDDGVPDKYIVD